LIAHYPVFASTRELERHRLIARVTASPALRAREDRLFGRHRATLAARLRLARHRRQEPRVWIEPVAKQLDAVEAIGEFYRFDRFAAPSELWDELQERFPELLKAA
jgi:hypothetical protein